MSGGAWNYQQFRIEEKAATMRDELVPLLQAVAKTEHIVDWAESCDTSKEKAALELYELWLATFNHLYEDEK